MVNFNLFPWRENQKIYQHKIIKKYFLISLIAALFIGTIIHLQLKNRRDNKLKIVTTLQQQFSYYENLTQTHKPKNNFSFENDDASTNQISFFTRKFFIEISKITEFNLCFTEIKRIPQAVAFYGLAYSALELSHFLLQWKAVNLFSHVEIKQFEKLQNGLVKFELHGFESHELEKVSRVD